MNYKLSQSTKDTILKAQTGDENAVAQVIEENMGLITKELTKWGYAPKTEDFEDTLSDIKVEMLQKIIPQWDPKRGAFSTFLTWAIYNFLRRGTRKKQYEEKQKEVSITEPIEEELTLEDTLEQPSSVLDHATLSNARENLQNWIHLKNPELENIVLRIFDLKTSAEYSNDQIAEILNSEGVSKGKPISRFMINNYVNDWIKPFIQQYLSSFKSASLSMKKKANVFDTTKEILLSRGLKAVPNKNTYDKKLREEYPNKVFFDILSSKGGTIIGNMNLENLSDDPLDASNQIWQAYVEGSSLDDIVNEVILDTAIKIWGEDSEEANFFFHFAFLDRDQTTMLIEKLKELGIDLKYKNGLLSGYTIPTKEQLIELKEWFETLSGKPETKSFGIESEEDIKKVMPEIEKVILEEKFKEEIPKSVEVPYSDLLNKYSPDEIWDIASGKKVDVTEKEIELAKEVISRGIIASKLNMRKTAGREDSAIEINKYLEDKHGFILSSYSKRMKHLMDYIIEKMKLDETFEGAIDFWCKETGNGHPDFRY